MREVRFKTRIGAIEGAYCGPSGDLVTLRDMSLRNRCVVCATPARRNIYRAEYEPFRNPIWHVPFFYDIPYFIFGTRYIVEFPFCSICTPNNFDIEAKWINKVAARFTGVSSTFLKLLPRVPLELAAELDGTWRQRALRSLLR